MYYKEQDLTKGNSAAKESQRYTYMNMKKRIQNEMSDYLWIRCFPAFVEPPGSVAQCFTFWIQALFAHIDGNILNFPIQIINMDL